MAGDVASVAMFYRKSVLNPWRQELQNVLLRLHTNSTVSPFVELCSGETLRLHCLHPFIRLLFHKLCPVPPHSSLSASTTCFNFPTFEKALRFCKYLVSPFLCIWIFGAFRCLIGGHQEWKRLNWVHSNLKGRHTTTTLPLWPTCLAQSRNIEKGEKEVCLL